jgi:hypothetical protein
MNVDLGNSPFLPEISDFCYFSTSTQDTGGKDGGEVGVEATFQSDELPLIFSVNNINPISVICDLVYSIQIQCLSTLDFVSFFSDINGYVRKTHNKHCLHQGLSTWCSRALRCSLISDSAL